MSTPSAYTLQPSYNETEVQSKVIDVLDFGAAGNATYSATPDPVTGLYTLAGTDDTAAIQTAIGAAEAMGGFADVLLPAGNYLISTPLFIRSSKITLRGPQGMGGKATLIQTLYSAPSVEVHGAPGAKYSEVSILNLDFFSPYTGASKQPIVGAAYPPTALVNACANYGTTVSTNGVDNDVLRNYASAVYIADAVSCLVQNCTFVNQVTGVTLRGDTTHEVWTTNPNGDPPTNATGTPPVNTLFDTDNRVIDCSFNFCDQGIYIEQQANWQLKGISGSNVTYSQNITTANSSVAPPHVIYVGGRQNNDGSGGFTRCKCGTISDVVVDGNTHASGVKVKFTDGLNIDGLVIRNCQRGVDFEQLYDAVISNVTITNMVFDTDFPADGSPGGATLQDCVNCNVSNLHVNLSGSINFTNSDPSGTAMGTYQSSFVSATGTYPGPTFDTGSMVPPYYRYGIARNSYGVFWNYTAGTNPSANIWALYQTDASGTPINAPLYTLSGSQSASSSLDGTWSAGSASYVPTVQYLSIPGIALKSSQAPEFEGGLLFNQYVTTDNGTLLNKDNELVNCSVICSVSAAAATSNSVGAFIIQGGISNSFKSCSYVNTTSNSVYPFRVGGLSVSSGNNFNSLNNSIILPRIVGSNLVCKIEAGVAGGNTVGTDILLDPASVPGLAPSTVQPINDSGLNTVVSLTNGGLMTPTFTSNVADVKFAGTALVTSAMTISNLLNGMPGQRLTVLATVANVIIASSNTANFRLSTAGTWTSSAGSTITFVYYNSKWYETARSL